MKERKKNQHRLKKPGRCSGTSWYQGRKKTFAFHTDFRYLSTNKDALWSNSEKWEITLSLKIAWRFFFFSQSEIAKCVLPFGSILLEVLSWKGFWVSASLRGNECWNQLVMPATGMGLAREDRVHVWLLSSTICPANYDKNSIFMYQASWRL